MEELWEACWALHDGMAAKRVGVFLETVCELCVHCAVVRQYSHLFSVHNCPSLRQGHPWTGGPSYSAPTISSISNAFLGSLFTEFTTCSSTKHPFLTEYIKISI